MRICEEKSSGIDKVVQAAEVYQLPAPDFRAGYQHCALRWVMSGHMTNQSLRERFHLPAGKSANVSQVIAGTIGAGLVKLDERVGTSRKLARYLPFWA